MRNADEVAAEGLRRALERRRANEYELKDLFDPDEWNAILPGRRRWAGRKFKALMAQRADGSNLGPNIQNHQRYR